MHRSAREVGTVRTCARPICMRLRLSPTISYNTTKKSRRWTFLSCDIWFRPAFVLRPRLRSFRTWKQPENRHPLPDPLPLSYLVRAQSIRSAATELSRSAPCLGKTFRRAPSALRPSVERSRSAPRQDLPSSTVRRQIWRRAQSIRRASAAESPSRDRAPSAVDLCLASTRASAARRSPSATRPERSRSTERSLWWLRRPPADGDP